MSRIFSDSAIRSILGYFPVKNIRTILSIAETMTSRSQEIIDKKKTALRSGDEELMQRVGEGKDIMSILRESA